MQPRRSQGPEGIGIGNGTPWNLFHFGGFVCARCALSWAGARAWLLPVFCWGLAACGQCDYRVLHHFTGSTNDGAEPLLGKLIQSGTTFYGMTQLGGSNNIGTVFKMNADGTDFEVLRSFASAASDGSRPYGSPLLSGSTPFGMVASEDTSYRGCIFRLGTDGSAFQVLHTFSGSEGKWPYDTLIQDGSVLYGQCTYGGNDTGSGWVGGGTIFRINIDGSGFQVLHTFNGGSADGWGPHGTPILSGGVLYGTTLAGGSGGNDLGVIFAVDLLPTIEMSIEDTDLILSWSTNFPDFTLESVDSLDGTWMPVAGVAGCSAVLPVSADANQFYRLRK